MDAAVPAPVGADPALAAMVRGRSDTEITTLAAVFGGPRALTDMFVAGLADHVRACRPRDHLTVACCVRHESEEFGHTLSVAAGAVQIDAVATEDAPTTIVVSFADLIRVMAGELAVPQAVQERRITVLGDPAGARVLADVLAGAFKQ